VVAAVALALFCFLAEAVASGRTVDFDNAIRLAIHAWASPAVTAAMIDISLLGDPKVLVPAAVLLTIYLVVISRRHAAVVFALALAGAELTEQILKLVFQRARPEAFFNYPPPLGYSFPSGHSFISICFYGLTAAILTYRARSQAVRILGWIAAGVVSVVIGFSRVYLGVHYTTDVLAGYCGAIVWAGSVAILVLPRTAAKEAKEDSTP